MRVFVFPRNPCARATPAPGDTPTSPRISGTPIASTPRVNYAMQISAQGASAAMYRQNVLTNNLANINTVGFKPDTAMLRQRDTARQEDGLYHLPSNELLEKLGAGVTPHNNRISFQQGPLQTTGNSLDLAIEGSGFFQVQSATAAAPSLTRDGRFTIGSGGTLVGVSTGMEVLSSAGAPIRLDRSKPVEIGADGSVRQNNQVVARIGIVDVNDRTALVKEGEGLFTGPAGVMASLRPASGAVRQFALEQAAVNEIDAMMDITSAAGAARRNLRMIGDYDRLMDRAINRLGRVSS